MLNEDLMTVAEVAGLFRVSRPTVYAWIKQGRLGVFQIGNTKRVRPSAVEKMLQQNSSHQEKECDWCDRKFIGSPADSCCSVDCIAARDGALEMKEIYRD